MKFIRLKISDTLFGRFNKLAKMGNIGAQSARMVRYSVFGDYGTPKKTPELLQHILMTKFETYRREFLDKLRISKLEEETWRKFKSVSY